MNVFITGHSSGFGKAIAIYAVNNNLSVFGLSRSSLNNKKIIQQKCNLANLDNITKSLKKFKFDRNIDLVILNAAELGTFVEFEKLQINDIKSVLDINAWSNKIILDFFVEKRIKIGQLVFITSGASLRNDIGWETYSISKIIINKLAKIYAKTLKNTHVCALSPGIINTKMQYELRQLDSTQFPSIIRLKEAYTENKIASAEDSAELLFARLGQMRTYKSGSFLKLHSI